MLHRSSRYLPSFKPLLARGPGTSQRRKLIMFLCLYGVAFGSGIASGLLLFVSWMKGPTVFSSTLILLISIAAAIVTKANAERELKGFLAEYRVGVRLQGLERYGFRVLHDFPGDGFNIDHVLIGPQGVFAVETKYVSKTKDGPRMLEYRDGRVFLGSNELRSNAVRQSQRNAEDLSKYLQNRGFKVLAKAVVLYPGWFIEAEKEKRQVWVLEPKALPKFLQQEPGRLEPDEVRRIHFALREVAERPEVQR